MKDTLKMNGFEELSLNQMEEIDGGDVSVGEALLAMAGGAFGGAITGVLAGSALLPGAGTAAGAFVGGINGALNGLIGAIVGDYITSSFDNKYYS